MAANNSVFDQYTVKELEDMGQSFSLDSEGLGRDIAKAISNRKQA